MFFQNLLTILFISCLVHDIHLIISTVYLEGITLRLKRIPNSDEKFTVRSIEYKNDLIAREYKPKVVEKHFSKIFKLSRAKG